MATVLNEAPPMYDSTAAAHPALMVEDSRVLNIRFSGWNGCNKSGDMVFCGYSLQPALLQPKKLRFVSAEYLVTTGPDGNRCLTLLRVEFTERRADAARQALSWLCVHAGISVDPDTGLSFGEAKRMMHRLKKGGCRFRLTAQVPVSLSEVAEPVDDTQSLVLNPEGDGADCLSSLGDIDTAAPEQLQGLAAAQTQDNKNGQPGRLGRTLTRAASILSFPFRFLNGRTIDHANAE
jgi:hypothetical protein